MAKIKYFNPDTNQWEYANGKPKASGNYINENFAPVIKESVSGEVIAVDDVSSVEHKVEVKASGKNLIDNAQLGIAEGWENLGAGYYGKKFYVGKGNIFTVSIPSDVNLSDYTGYIKVCYTHNTSVENSFFIQIKDYADLPQTGTAREDYIYVAVTGLSNIPIEKSDFYTKYPWQKLMINYGTEPLIWSPYISPQEIASANVNVYNSNLISFDDVYNALYDHDNRTKKKIVDGKEYVYIFNCGLWYKARIDKGIKYLPNHSYKISYVGFTDEEDTNSYDLTIHYTDGSYKIIGKVRGTTPTTYSLISDSSKTIDYIRMSYSNGISTYLTDVQISPYDVPYEESIKSTYVPNTDGTVNGIKSISPNMTMYANKQGILLNTTYQPDTKQWVLSQIAKKKSTPTTLEYTPVEEPTPIPTPTEESPEVIQ